MANINVNKKAHHLVGLSKILHAINQKATTSRFSRLLHFGILWNRGRIMNLLASRAFDKIEISYLYDVDDGKPSWTPFQGPQKVDCDYMVRDRHYVSVQCK